MPVLRKSLVSAPHFLLAIGPPHTSHVQTPYRTGPTAETTRPASIGCETMCPDCRRHFLASQRRWDISPICCDSASGGHHDGRVFARPAPHGPVLRGPVRPRCAGQPPRRNARRCRPRTEGRLSLAFRAGVARDTRGSRRAGRATTRRNAGQCPQPRVPARCAACKHLDGTGSTVCCCRSCPSTM